MLRWRACDFPLPRCSANTVYNRSTNQEIAPDSADWERLQVVSELAMLGTLVGRINDIYPITALSYKPSIRPRSHLSEVDAWMNLQPSPDPTKIPKTYLDGFEI